jgi:putative ABC transport system substrate-binding protein
MLRFVIACAWLGAAACAHGADIPRIAVLWPGDVPPWTDAFIAGLRESGFVDGQTAKIDIRSTGQKFETGASLASELIALRPQVVFASPGILAKHAIHALEQSRQDIPVVVLSSDPVNEGLVPAAARHGKNITGLAVRPGPELATKHLQLVRDLLPHANRVAYVIDKAWYAGSYFETAHSLLVKAGRDLGISIIQTEVASSDQLEAKLAELAQKQVSAAIIPGGPTFSGNRERIARLAMKHRLPVIYSDELYVRSGGLLSYGTSVADMERRAGSVVARILRGTKATDIPVEYPTRFYLVINLAAAASIGMEIPQSVLLLADEVIR